MLRHHSMPKIVDTRTYNGASLPYNIRVEGVDDTNGSIVMSKLNKDTGQWEKWLVTQEEWITRLDAYGIGLPDTRDYEAPLLICPSAGDYPMCSECNCCEVHQSCKEGMGRLGDMDPKNCSCPDECTLISDEEYSDIEELYDEYYPVLIQECMPTLTMGRGFSNIYQWVTPDLEKLLNKFTLNKFGQVKSLRSPAKDTKIKFRRYANP